MITVECNGVLNTLNQASKDLKSSSRSGALHNYLRDMWQVGYDQAKADYDSALTKEGEKANRYTTLVSKPVFKDNGFELTASGEDVYFLEFGTGLEMDYTNPYAAQLGFFPSSYSGGPNGKGFLIPPKLNHFHGAWPHEGRLHWGQNPARGMYNAYKAMEFFARNTPIGLFK